MHTMADIIEKTRKLLRKQGRTRSEIEQCIRWMETTCVACKHAMECRRTGKVTNPYHERCENHEYVNDFIH